LPAPADIAKTDAKQALRRMVGATAMNNQIELLQAQQQLGLRLEPIKSSADTLVIDHIERPTEN